MSSKSEARVANFAGYDSFVNSKHKPADVLFGGGMGIKTVAAVIMMSFTSLFSCKDIPDIKPDGMKVYMSLPLEQKYNAAWDSLGFFDSNLKSAGKSVKFYDGRTGQINEIIIDEAKSTPTELIGTRTISGANGEYSSVSDIKITEAADLMGFDMAESVSGYSEGVRTYKVGDGSVKNVGVKDFQNGKLKWILRPVGDKKISAKFIENGVETSVENFLTIL